MVRALAGGFGVFFSLHLQCLSNAGFQILSFIEHNSPTCRWGVLYPHPRSG